MKHLLIRILFLAITLPMLIAADKEGGIIGTGVVGQITGLGQFEVSGMQFELDQNIPLDGVSSLRELEMGMILAVRAIREGNDWRATQIRRIQVVVGPVTSPSQVMGIPIIGDLPETGRVSIDGFWSEAGIVATRIEAIGPGEDSITGPVNQIKRVGNLMTDNGTQPSIEEDGILTIKGAYSDGSFVIRSTDVGLFKGIEPNLLMAEGYFSKPDQNGETRFIGTGARSTLENPGSQDLQIKSTRCSFNGRLDFELNEVRTSERETVVSLCANLPR
ncbi:MAG: DUF5666 domain-containing protein [Pseudomonadota bacterium]